MTAPFHPPVTLGRESKRFGLMMDDLDNLFDIDAIERYYELRDEMFDHLDRIANTYGPDFAQRVADDCDFPWSP